MIEPWGKSNLLKASDVSERRVEAAYFHCYICAEQPWIKINNLNQISKLNMDPERNLGSL